MRNPSLRPVSAVRRLPLVVSVLFAPAPFRLVGFPVQTALGFLLGAFASSRLPPLRRLFVSRRAARAEVYRAARAAFVDLGVSRTSGRWGVLVLAATFERRVEVVADVGIDVAAFGAPWQAAVGALEAAVRRADYDAFLEALRALGPLLGAQHPRRPDDIDELDDAVATEAAGDAAEGG